MPNVQPLTPEQVSQWDELATNLHERGIRFEEVNALLMKEYPSVRYEEGFWEAGGRVMNTHLQLKHVIYGFLGVAAFAGILKLIGMAFNINIPLLHKADNGPLMIEGPAV